MVVHLQSVISLFGRVMNINFGLFSDWLFHSAAQCWSLLWLAVSQCCSMLGSPLIGCFTVLLNVGLSSDWLFHSAAQCWALIWLAVSQRGSMLGSPLIGCFTARLNVGLSSDWLFYSTAQCWAVLWLAVSRRGSMLASPDWLFHSAAQCWALLWLAVSRRGTMLGSSLIGCFTARLNVGLFSDWRRERGLSCECVARSSCYKRFWTCLFTLFDTLESL